MPTPISVPARTRAWKEPTILSLEIAVHLGAFQHGGIEVTMVAETLIDTPLLLFQISRTLAKGEGQVEDLGRHAGVHELGFDLFPLP